MVNILAADLMEKNGTSPSRQVKEKYARGIVSLFPYLRDPFSRTGHEHYYYGESGTGYLAWRIKTIQRSTARDKRSSYGGTSREDGLGGPAARRETQFVPESVLSEDECKEAIALMKHCPDEDTIKKKMKLTFDFRRNMVLDPQQSSNVLSLFPRFKDVKGLVEQDFVLMFGEDVSGKFLEKWTTAFKKKIIQQCRKLPSTSELENLLLAADNPEDGTEVDDNIGTNIQEHLDSITSSAQPYLLALGRNKKTVHQFFVILDKNAISCRSASALGAFDELFKVHYVFATTYNPMLYNMFTFIQTTVYNIDVGKVKESPRVA
ncbi:hypothetical protein D5F01_LYC22411 [Larimichthys crocea]|uniref:Uncharacterized protein n=1 Tax=Larimichthys crocea TaxID=215358 RepID=A0A6G0HI08_LARCR|nr:hypothetical protein D5F01_LYC22411 [Larimichthys crocea]